MTLLPPEGFGGLPAAALRDAVLYRVADGPTRTADLPALYNLCNLLLRGLSHGVVVNSARAGLGTHTPTGHRLAGEGLYYQALRVYSCFDHALERALREDPAIWPLPQSLALLAGRFPRRFLAQRDDEQLAPIVRSERALRALAPRLEPFAFRRLRREDCWLEPGDRALGFGKEVRAELWCGTASKLRAIARDAQDPNVEAKLAALVGVFAPLCTVIQAGFDEHAPHLSSTRMTLYLPPFHTLHASDDDPESWRLAQGLARTALPQPVQIHSAEITHLRYLEEPAPERFRAMRLEIQRRFGEPREVITEMSFGSLFSGTQDELFAFDAEDPRDAPHVTYRVTLPLGDDGGDTARPLKQAVNRLLGWFEIDARIHRLTLHLSTATEPTLNDADALLRPRFSLERSQISFRVHRRTDRMLERMWLRTMGFEVPAAPDSDGLYHCRRDFRTWAQLRDELLAVQIGARWPAVLRREGELLSRLVGVATREVLQRSIANIEAAIDGEIGRILGEYLDRAQQARRVLGDRLHEGLF